MEAPCSTSAFGKVKRCVACFMEKTNPLCNLRMAERKDFFICFEKDKLRNTEQPWQALEHL